MTTPKPSSEAPVVGVQFSKDAEFLDRYANNAYLESSGWDLKIVFGQTDQQIAPNAVIQHTGITVSWPYAKVLAFWLQIHLAAKEAEDGKILVPKGVIGDVPLSLPQEIAVKLKHPNEGIEAMRKIYDDFIAANPEVKS